MMRLRRASVMPLLSLGAWAATAGALIVALVPLVLFAFW